MEAVYTLRYISLITIKMNVDFHVKVNDKIDRKVLTYPLFLIKQKISSLWKLPQVEYVNICLNHEIIG